MANVKNFGLVGVGSTVQWAKGGSRIKTTGSAFNLRNAADSADVALTTAGITSSAGNVTLTTGNVVLSSNAGVVTLGDAGNIARAGTGVFQLSGTGAVVAPSGTTAERPTAASYPGGFRYNTTTSSMEYSNGSAWSALSTGGGTVTSVDVSGGTTGLSFTGGPITSSGTITMSGTLDADNGGTGLSSFAFGSVLYASAADTWSAAAPGSTSGVQAWDADLDALAALSTTGFLVRTGAGTATTRSLTESVGRITITNADGVSGSPTFDLATVTDTGTGSFLKFTRDTYGRVEGTTAVVQSDITGLVDSVYVNVAGDTMSGTLNMGSNQISGLAPGTSGTDAVNKNQLDAAVSGLSWKQAVVVGTTANVPGFSAGTITIPNNNATYFPNAGDAVVIDGITLANGDRVLVKDQTTAAQNGIYVVTDAGEEGATDAVLTRASDMDTAAEFSGAAVFVTQGTANADTGWTQTAEVTTVNTSPVVWAQFTGAGTYTAGTGLSLSGNTFNVNLGAGIVELPTDEVGIHLYDSSTGAIILTTDGTSRSTTAGSMLHLLLAGSGGLSQGASGLTIATSGVTNAMLQNSTITLDADSGSGSVALGGTLDVVGVANRTVTSTGSSQIVVDISSNYAGQSTITTLGTVTTGTWNASTITVPYGGTGATTLLDTAILIGNGTGAVEATNNLTYDSTTEVLTVGGSNGVSIDTLTGGDVTITALNTDADINLNPNGTGSVIIGPSGADGEINSDTGQGLTITGDTFLTLTSTNGDVTVNSADDLLINLPNNTSAKVTLTTVTAANYATSLSDNDLVNKYYVDQAISSATVAGDVIARQATVSLTSAGTTNIGAVLPAGATILSVKVNVTTASDAVTTLTVGKTGSLSAYMTAAENDPETTGLYLAETMVTEAGSVQLLADVATPGTVGSATVVVTFKTA